MENDSQLKLIESPSIDTSGGLAREKRIEMDDDDFD